MQTVSACTVHVRYCVVPTSIMFFVLIVIFLFFVSYQRAYMCQIRKELNTLHNKRTPNG